MTLIATCRTAALLVGALAAAISATSNVHAAQNVTGPAFPTVTAAPAILPVPSGARRPVRHSEAKACNGLCWFAIYKVGPGQLLQIDNVSCINQVTNANDFKYFAISSGFNFNAPLTGIIPATQLIAADAANTTVIANVSGPYFFGPNEGVYMFAGGSGYTVTCTISGWVSAAQ